MKKSANLADKQAAKNLLKQLFTNTAKDGNAENNTQGVAGTSGHSRVVEHAPITEDPFL